MAHSEQELVVKTEQKYQSPQKNDHLLASITCKDIPDDNALWFLSEPSNPCSFLQELRWKINLWGLYHPLRCIPRVAFVTVSDIFLFILFLLWIVGILLFDIKQSNEGITSKLARLHGVALALARGAVRNFFLTLILIQRNTILRYIFGLPFERAIAYHELISRMGIMHVWAHFILLIIYYSAKSDTSVAHLLGTAPGLIGFLAFICCDIGAIIAYDKNRRKCFEVFYASHQLLMPLFTILMIVHVPFNPFGLLLLIAFVSHVIDIFIKMCIITLSRPVTLKSIDYLEDLNVVKIVWNKKHFKFSGGQYVFVAIPSISRRQFHPFSISCPVSADDEDCTIHIKCVGDFVEKLKALSVNANIDIDQMQILIDGPYGRPSIPHLRYESMILMCGGIGITPMISIFYELVNNAKVQKKVSTKRIHFVWSVKTAQMLKEFDVIIKQVVLKHSVYEDTVSETTLREEIVINGHLWIKISYYVTDKNVADNESEQQKWKEIYPNLYFKRPDAKVVIDEALQSKGNKCIGIMGCGPLGMTQSIQRHSAVNGIHCHTEKFYF